MDEMIIIPGSRMKTLLFLAFAISLSALFIWSTWAFATGYRLASLNPHHVSRHVWMEPLWPVLGPVLAILCAVGAGMMAVLLVNPPRLEVGPTGVIQRHAFRPAAWRWDEIENIRLVPGSLATRVAFDDYRLRRAGEERPRVARISEFPPVFAITAKALVELMSDGKQRWGSPHLAQEAPTA